MFFHRRRKRNQQQKTKRRRGTRILQDVLANNYGLVNQLQGWTLVSATAISGNGDLIAGVGVNPIGNFQGWVVAVPEPSTISLAGLAFLPLFATVRARRRRPRALVFLLVVWAAALGSVDPAQATPITLQFDTTVASIAGLPLGLTQITDPLPFTIHEGDPLRVSFTFEPGTGAVTYPQTGELALSLNGHDLIAAPFKVSISNDGFGAIDTRGRFAEPFRTPAVDIASFRADRITVACENFGTGYCGEIAGSEVFKFTTQLIFEDALNLQLLTSDDLSIDINTWNAFPSRELQIGFNNGAFVGAYIGAVVETAEPTTVRLFIALIATLGVRRLLTRTKRRTLGNTPCENVLLHSPTS